MEEEKKKQESNHSAQEVEEIVFLDSVEKELESIERSFDSGDMQSFGRNKAEIMGRFLDFRRKDEELFHRHCDAIMKANLANEAEEDEERNGEDEVKARKESLMQARVSIQEKTVELRKLL